VWAISSGATGTDRIVRIEGDRVARRLPVPGSARSVLAAAPEGLWIAVGDDLRGRYRLQRLDPERGRVTAEVDLGSHRPVGLVSTPAGLCVVGGDGTVVIVA